MDLAAFAGTPKLGTLPERLFPQKEFILVILPRTFHFAISILNIRCRFRINFQQPHVLQ